jgi:membrane-associated protein
MFDLLSLIQAGGYVGLFLIVFAESGLFFGFFLPGDSLLFTAGLLASQGLLNIWLLVPLLFVAAVLGDAVGYWFGRKVGPRIFSKKDSVVFNPEHVKKAHDFFEKHGKKAIILARFLPIIRTFTPIVAGVAKMEYSVFLAFNLLGGLFWTVGLLLLGYFLGSLVPNADRYLLPIVLMIIVVSLLPGIYEIYKARRK